MKKATKNGKVETVEVDATKANGKVKIFPACLCGCGAVTKGGRFIPGHDARHHGNLLRAGDTKALKALGWA